VIQTQTKHNTAKKRYCNVCSKTCI